LKPKSAPCGVKFVNAFLFDEKMVGIYKKIKDVFNWFQDKGSKALNNYIIPGMEKLGDIANSDIVKGVMKVAGPTLDGFAPGLGTGLNTALGFVRKGGSLAKKARTGGMNSAFKDVVGGFKQSQRKRDPTQGGMSVATEITDIHPRLELKALMPAEDEYSNANGSYVEELD
jgi:hypothetical protein